MDQWEWYAICAMLPSFFVGVPSRFGNACSVFTFFLPCSSSYMLLLFSLVRVLSCSQSSFHSILCNLLVRCRKVVVFNLSRIHFEMINPSNCMNVLADRASNLLSSTFSTTSAITTLSQIMNAKWNVFRDKIFTWIQNSRDHCYGEVNQPTSQRKRQWKTVKYFWRIPH